MKLNCIHIFSYGESQIISDTLNYKTGVDNFKKLQAVIDDVKAKKPTDVQAKDYHVINIFSNMRVDYNAKEKEGSFRFDFKDLNQTKLNALIAEFEALKAADKSKTPA